MDTSKLSTPELKSLLEYIPDPFEAEKAARASRRAAAAAAALGKPGVPRLASNPWIRWKTLANVRRAADAMSGALVPSTSGLLGWDAALAAPGTAGSSEDAIGPIRPQHSASRRALSATSEKPSHHHLTSASSPGPSDSGAQGWGDAAPLNTGEHRRADAASDGDDDAKRLDRARATIAARRAAEAEAEDAKREAARLAAKVAEQVRQEAEAAEQVLLSSGDNLWRMLAGRSRASRHLRGTTASARSPVSVPLSHPILSLTWIRPGIDSVVPIRCILGLTQGSSLEGATSDAASVSASVESGFETELDALLLPEPARGHAAARRGTAAAAMKFLAGAGEPVRGPGPSLSAAWDGPASLPGARHVASSMFCISAGQAGDKGRTRSIRVTLTATVAGCSVESRSLIRVAPPAASLMADAKSDTLLGLEFMQPDTDAVAAMLHDDSLDGSLDVHGRRLCDMLLLEVVLSDGKEPSEDALLLQAEGDTAENSAPGFSVSWDSSTSILTIAPASTDVLVSALAGLSRRLAYRNRSGIRMTPGVRVVEARLVDPVLRRAAAAVQTDPALASDAEHRLLAETPLRRRLGVLLLRAVSVEVSAGSINDAPSGRSGMAQGLRAARMAALAALQDFRKMHKELPDRFLWRVVAVKRAERILKRSFLPRARARIQAARDRAAAKAEAETQRKASEVLARQRKAEASRAKAAAAKRKAEAKLVPETPPAVSGQETKDGRETSSELATAARQPVERLKAKPEPQAAPARRPATHERQEERRPTATEQAPGAATIQAEGGLPAPEDRQQPASTAAETTVSRPSRTADAKAPEALPSRAEAEPLLQSHDAVGDAGASHGQAPEAGPLTSPKQVQFGSQPGAAPALRPTAAGDETHTAFMPGKPSEARPRSVSSGQEAGGSLLPQQVAGAASSAAADPSDAGESPAPATSLGHSKAIPATAPGVGGPALRSSQRSTELPVAASVPPRPALDDRGPSPAPAGRGRHGVPRPSRSEMQAPTSAGRSGREAQGDAPGPPTDELGGASASKVLGSSVAMVAKKPARRVRVIDSGPAGKVKAAADAELPGVTPGASATAWEPAALDWERSSPARSPSDSEVESLSSVPEDRPAVRLTQARSTLALPNLPHGWRWSVSTSRPLAPLPNRPPKVQIRFEADFGWQSLFEVSEEQLLRMSRPRVAGTVPLTEQMEYSRRALMTHRGVLMPSMVANSVAGAMSEAEPSSGISAERLASAMSRIRTNRLLLRQVFARSPPGLLPELALNDKWTGHTWDDGWRYFSVVVPALANEPTLEIVARATPDRAMAPTAAGDDASCVLFASSTVLPTPWDHDARSAIIGRGASRLLISYTDPFYVRVRDDSAGMDRYLVAVWVSPGSKVGITVETRTWTMPTPLRGDFGKALDKAAETERRVTIADSRAALSHLDAEGTAQPDEDEGHDWSRLMQVIQILDATAVRPAASLHGLDDQLSVDSGTDTDSSGVSVLNPGLGSVVDEDLGAYEQRRQRRRQRRLDRRHAAKANAAIASAAANAYRLAMAGARGSEGPFDKGRAAAAVAQAREQAAAAVARATAEQRSVGLREGPGPRLESSPVEDADSMIVAEAAAAESRDFTLRGASAHVMDLLSEPEFTPEPDPADSLYEPQFALSLGLDTGVELLLGPDPSAEDIQVVEAARRAAAACEGGASDVEAQRLEHSAASMELFLRSFRTPDVPVLLPRDGGKPSALMGTTGRREPAEVMARNARAKAASSTGAGLKRSEMRRYRLGVRAAKRTLCRSTRRAAREAKRERRRAEAAQAPAARSMSGPGGGQSESTARLAASLLAASQRVTAAPDDAAATASEHGRARSPAARSRKTVEIPRPGLAKIILPSIVTPNRRPSGPAARD